MARPYILYGWHLSYFTGKARCYLKYKGLPFIDQEVDLLTLAWRIPRRTGVRVMPVLRTPADEWIQDTHLIIDRIEAEVPERSVIPDTPWQRWLAYLLEAWADEWWVPIAMHTRWSYPENYALFQHDAGRALLPGFPRVVQRKAVDRIAGYLRSMLPAVGIRPEQNAVLEAWAHAMMAQLDTHFAAHSYLMGGRPTLADFGLVGTMYGHLGRDPWPKREMVARYPHLRAWIDRMAAPPERRMGALFPGDEIPPTLEPIVQQVLAECQPWFAGTAGEVSRLVREHPERFPPGKPLPRKLGDITLRTAQGSFQRAALPFTLWLAQRPRDAYDAMDASGQARVRQQLQARGGLDLLDGDWPRLERHGLGATLASQLRPPLPSAARPAAQA